MQFVRLESANGPTHASVMARMKDTPERRQEEHDAVLH